MGPLGPRSPGRREVSGQPPVVIDASVAIARLLDEPEAPEIMRALARWVAEGRRLIVPAHFWLEVLNRIRRVPETTGERMVAAIHRLNSFDLETAESTPPMLLQIIDRIERYGLTPYDAAYLVLAEDVGGQLATLDRDLAAAAGSRAITFGDDHRLHDAPAVYEHDVTWPNYKEASAYLAKLRMEALAGRSPTSPKA